MSNEREELLVRIKEVLDESCENLDPGTLGQLRERRSRALAGEAASLTVGKRWYTAVLGEGGNGGAYASAALLTSLAVVAVAGWFWLARPAELQDLSALANLDLLTAAEEPEFYEQLDFYLWLEDETES